MTPRTPKSNAPLHSREKKALKRLEELTKKYIAVGLNETEARDQARRDMRDNGRGDWRNG